MKTGKPYKTWKLQLSKLIHSLLTKWFQTSCSLTTLFIYKFRYYAAQCRTYSYEYSQYRPGKLLTTTFNSHCFALKALWKHVFISIHGERGVSDDIAIVWHQTYLILQDESILQVPQYGNRTLRIWESVRVPGRKEGKRLGQYRLFLKE